METFVAIVILLGWLRSTSGSVADTEFCLDAAGPDAETTPLLESVPARSPIECSTLCMAAEADLVGHPAAAAVGGCKAWAYSPAGSLCFLSPSRTFNFAGAGPGAEIFRSAEGDAFNYNNNKPFSTMDAGTKTSCSQQNSNAGWWFSGCTHPNPNGYFNLSVINSSLNSEKYMQWLYAADETAYVRPMLRSIRLMLEVPSS